MMTSDKLLPVLNTTDPMLLAMVKSVLEAAAIPFIVQGEAGVHFFPLGAAGSRVTNRSTGTIVLVEEGRFEEARALLDTPAEEG
jgi:hypothetical protein